jgi:hypothetical protein
VGPAMMAKKNATPKHGGLATRKKHRRAQDKVGRALEKRLKEAKEKPTWEDGKGPKNRR